MGQENILLTTRCSSFFSKNKSKIFCLIMIIFCLQINIRRVLICLSCFSLFLSLNLFSFYHWLYCLTRICSCIWPCNWFMSRKVFNQQMLSIAYSSLGDIKVNKSLNPCPVEPFIFVNDFVDHLRFYFGFKVKIFYHR